MLMNLLIFSVDYKFGVSYSLPSAYMRGQGCKVKYVPEIAIMLQ